jgi:LysM repeat protein
VGDTAGVVGLNTLARMSRRTTRSARLSLALGAVVAAALLGGGCGDFQLAEFTRATTTTVEVEAAPTTIVDVPPETTPVTVRPARYVVLPGESLGSIATKFGVPVAALMEVNGIVDANALEAGREIVIPDPEAPIPPPWQQRDDLEGQFSD